MFRKLHEFEAGITVFVDDVATTAEPGESVAAVLLRQEKPWSRLTPVSESPRTAYCMMGVCFDCLAEVDGTASVQTCLMPVCDGIRVNRQLGKRKVDR